MDIESNQLASALLALTFAAVMLVTGLLFIERSDRNLDTQLSITGSVRNTDDIFSREGFLRAGAVLPQLSASTVKSKGK
jgi:hypothetical protein